MTKFAFKNPKFITTALKPVHYPELRDTSGVVLPEIAVAGRSNVGKSSLLNNLFGTRALVKTSSTPGKTQALNFFTVDEGLGLCDLPGYGYAKVSKSERVKWGPMIQRYLEERKSLKVILFLLDIRRMPNEDDRRFLDWVVGANKAVILILTKVDKVNQTERKKRTTKILEAINLENLHYIQYSTTKKVGRQELIKMVNEALADEMEE
ncbi:Probable GTP-binding protein EngB [Chlamydiales bacterium SCGC AG-110-P3]|nr:Probable GTP-binding protein EngB [Chlamydiales bacterium SCGC AG-110-P3]